MARSVEEAIDELMRVDDDGDEYELSTSSEEEVDDLTTSVPGSDLTVNAAHSQSSSRASSVEAAPPSLLSRLRPPTSSEPSRKRVIDRNPPKGKKRTKGPSRQSEPKSITPEQRLKDARYANEGLTVSNKKLFCRACREELSVKTSVINNHIKSAKHKSSKVRLDKKTGKRCGNH